MGFFDQIGVPQPWERASGPTRRRNGRTITLEMGAIDLLTDIPEVLNYWRGDTPGFVSLDVDREAAREILARLKSGDQLAWEALFWFDEAVTSGLIDAEDAYLGWCYRAQRPRIELYFMVERDG